MKLRNLLLTFCTVSCSVTLAEDAYYSIPLTSLKLVEGHLPSSFNWSRSAWENAETSQPYAVVDGEGEVYVGSEALQPWGSPGRAFQNMTLAIQAVKGRDVTGRLFVPKSDLSSMIVLKFKVDAASEKQESKKEFLKAKEEHYRHLRERNIPGGAWFRHQESEAAKARGTNVVRGREMAFNPRRFQRWDENYESTYELFSGGRALSENLQLDRLMGPAGSNSTMVALSNLVGINVHEMDWNRC